MVVWCHEIVLLVKEQRPLCESYSLMYKRARVKKILKHAVISVIYHARIWSEMFLTIYLCKWFVFFVSSLIYFWDACLCIFSVLFHSAMLEYYGDAEMKIPSAEHPEM